MSDPLDALDKVFDTRPEVIKKVWPESVVTTDVAMGILTDEDRADKYNVYAQCQDCAKWTYIEGSAETHGHHTDGATCSHCGSPNFDPTSVTSKRTFNPAIRRAPKGYKK